MANSANRQSLIQYLTGSQAGLAMGSNYVVNPSGFRNTNNITVSGATVTRNTTTPLTSISDLSVTLGNNATDTIYWSTNTLDRELSGNNCEFRFSYTASSIGSNVVAAVKQGSNIVAKSSALGTATTPQVVSVNVPCGDLSSATTVGLINDTGNTGTSAIKVANLTYGRATNLSNVSQAQFWGSAVSTETTNCDWTGPAGSWANFSADADCPTPTLAGKVESPTTKIPGIRLRNLPAGTYQVIVTGSFRNTTGTGQDKFRLSDGTNNSGLVSGFTTDDSSQHYLIGYFTYTTAQSDVTIQIQGIHTGGGGAPGIEMGNRSEGLQFNVYYFPSSSEIALNSNSTPWYIDANIGGATINLGTADVTSYTEMTSSGLDLVVNTGSAPVGIACSGTNASTVGTLTCAAGNESNGITFNISKSGSYLACASFMHRGAVTLGGGSPTATTFQIIETPSNAQTNLQLGKTRIGSFPPASSSEGLYAPYRLCGTFMFDSIGQKTLRVMYEQNSGGSTYSASEIISSRASGIGQADIHWEVYPITNQQPQPLLVGSVTSNSTGLERIERVKITCSGSSSIVSQSGTWVSSIGNISAGACTLTLASGMFSEAPTCTGSDRSNFISTGNILAVNPASTTSIIIDCEDDASTACTNFDASILCMGPRA